MKLTALILRFDVMALTRLEWLLADAGLEKAALWSLAEYVPGMSRLDSACAV